MSEEQVWRRPRPAGRRGRSPRAVGVRALLVALAAGPVVGALWWLTSPGGLRPPPDYLGLLQAAGGATAALALWCLAAGAAAGTWWVVARTDTHDARAVARLVGLLVGGLLGAGLAWGTGVLLRLLRPVEVADVSADLTADLLPVAPGPGVLAAVLLWPLATGLLVLVDTLRELGWQALTRPDEPGSPSAG